MESYQGKDRHERLIQMLRIIRNGAGLTQVQLAAKLGKMQSYVSKYELGERRIDVLELIDICDACGVEISEFLGELKK